MSLCLTLRSRCSQGREQRAAAPLLRIRLLFCWNHRRQMPCCPLYHFSPLSPEPSAALQQSVTDFPPAQQPMRYGNVAFRFGVKLPLARCVFDFVSGRGSTT